MFLKVLNWWFEGYFLVVGQSNSYRYYGRYDYDAKAGLNSLSVWSALLFNNKTNLANGSFSYFVDSQQRQKNSRFPRWIENQLWFPQRTSQFIILYLAFRTLTLSLVNKELYSGTLMGSLKQESVGKMVFSDEKNGFTCEVKFGEVKKKPSDYFIGDIMQKGKVISKCSGTYLGYIDFDG